ncbi:hypothetical protein [Streptomyces sp. Ncost-T10-10d]|uniref:hypothetical protein n=1 Tax=Streptomyces sp. Ncost-T10-10d TaxID=1839774 RepID=UPI00114CEF7F|nr:hypothetical protein [Streptomyces sp. Ncost-T10-10d]
MVQRRSPMLVGVQRKQRHHPLTPDRCVPPRLAFDHRSHLYSLGCVLYESVTERRPLSGMSWHLVHQHINEQLRALRRGATSLRTVGDARR